MTGPNPKKNAQDAKGGIEILEEAVELLRQAPLSSLAAYYLGSVPFGLGFLHFWSDMCRSSLAYQNISQEAFGVAFLFLWMKIWQTVFTRVLWLHLAHGQEASWTLGRFIKTALLQAAIHPWGFLAIPVAGLVLLPFAWVYAFFQNVTVMGEGSLTSLKELRRKSWGLSKLWPRQNHMALLCASGFGLFVFLNLESALYIGPLLMKELLGIETVFSRSFYSLFNTTYLALGFMLTYLCVDPILKAVYTLRCFYGESLYSGEDLKADLKAASTPAAVLR
jgi:hypothetical protein